MKKVAYILFAIFTLMGVTYLYGFTRTSIDLSYKNLTGLDLEGHLKITIDGNDISEFNLMRSGEHTFEIDGPLGINEKRKLMLAFGKDNRIDEIEIQAIPVTLTVLCNLDKGNIKLNRLNGFDSLDSK